MPCAYENCQFGEDEELIAHEDQNWCQFHLPLEAKNEWTLEQLVEFAGAVFAIIGLAKANDGIANFRGAAFPNQFNFKRDNLEQIQFPTLNFSNATFGDDTHLGNITFGDVTDFGNATFGDRTNFDNATFGEDTRFENATFGKFTSFENATFGDNARFTDATFGDGTDFDNATFGVETNFWNATFGEDTRFNNATFGDWTDFDNATFSGAAFFRAAMPGNYGQNVISTISFAGTRFGGPAFFHNRRFLGETDFTNAIFEQAPQFHDCKLHQDTNFRGTEFLDRSHHSAPAYRTLKQHMEETRDRVMQSKFFALEQECRMKDPETPRAVRLGLRLYGFFSDFGQSVWLPLENLIFVLLVLLVGYTAAIDAITGAPPDLGDVLRFDLQQLFRPFLVFATDAKLPGGDQLVPIWLALIAALHSLFNFGMLTLFVVAVRRWFRMG